MSVPVIPAWMLQWNGNTPATGKVLEAVALPSMTVMSDTGVAGLSKVTLWTMPELLTHTTVVFFATVAAFGTNVLAPMQNVPVVQLVGVVPPLVPVTAEAPPPHEAAEAATAAKPKDLKKKFILFLP